MEAEEGNIMVSLLEEGFPETARVTAVELGSGRPMLKIEWSQQGNVISVMRPVDCCVNGKELVEKFAAEVLRVAFPSKANFSELGLSPSHKRNQQNSEDKGRIPVELVESKSGTSDISRATPRVPSRSPVPEEPKRQPRNQSQRQLAALQPNEKEAPAKKKKSQRDVIDLSPNVPPRKPLFKESKPSVDLPIQKRTEKESVDRPSWGPLNGRLSLDLGRLRSIPKETFDHNKVADFFRWLKNLDVTVMDSMTLHNQRYLRIHAKTPRPVDIGWILKDQYVQHLGPWPK